MKDSIVIKQSKNRDWRTWTILGLGIFVLVNSIIWIVLSGGRFFEEIDPSTNVKPKYYNDLNRVFGPFYMLGYFTMQTNLFTGIMLIVLSFGIRKQNTQSWFMGSNILITITFLVFWLLIAPFYDSWKWHFAYFTTCNIFIHGVNPIVSFVVMFCIRKNVVLNKRILGIVSLWMGVFYVYSAIFYGASSTIDYSKGEIDGSTIYSFLDLQKLFFLDLKNHMALSIFLNILLCLVCPFLPIGIAWIWIKVFKIKTTRNSYFAWIDALKNKFANNKYDF